MNRLSQSILWSILLAITAACGSDSTSEPEFLVRVGPEGLGIELPDEARLKIPAGALQVSTGLGFRAAKASELSALPSGFAAASTIYEVTPHGLKLEKSVTLTLPHRAKTAANLRVLRLADDRATKWTRVVDSVAFDSKVATIELDRFSYYVVVQQEGDGGLPMDGEDAGSEPQLPTCTDAQALTNALVAGGMVLEAGTCWQVSELVSLSEGTLDIKAGVRLEFATDAGLRIRGGRLKVGGTMSSPVLFTSQDPLVRWRGVELTDSQGVDNVWEHLVIERAGSQTWTGAVFSGAAVYLGDSTALTMEGVTIRDSDSHGLVALSGAVFSFDNGALLDSRYPAYLHPNAVSGLGAETTFSGNDNAYVRVGFSNIDSVDNPAQWPKLSVPYRLEERTTINADLTLTAGTVMEMAQGVALRVASGGSLTAVGKASSPIVFRAAAAGTRGYWKGIELMSSGTATAPVGATFDHCQIADGGSDGWSGAPESVATLYMESSSSAAITNTTIDNGGRYGLWASNDARLPGFADNKFTNNVRPMLLHPDRVGELDGATTVAGNDEEAIFVSVNSSSRVTADATWRDLGVPYRIRTRFFVDRALALAAGVSLEFAQDTSMIVGTTGSLSAQGTAGNPVTLAGEKSVDDGYWLGIQIDSVDPANVLTNTTISHAGFAPWTGDPESIAALYLSAGAQVDLRSVTVGPGGGYGVFLAAASSTLKCSGVTFDTLARGNVFDDDTSTAFPDCLVQ